ncbi:hypothetical protein HBH56_133340 [Parastagonospora nodorum]|uniref:Uncharacterized protein n=2 Tax=Phaeosphaeria nodorum (strain SN15 / ATCC MYA-4574 / FGSC 10173) TaxID=321614 RepID=A0A7U2FEJ0_PHANO|nr:hypothetical protein SNOG_11486 [Parastagonospora nodorum SN15]KAH3911321.1 hypothetical protein HBH56_133340 [Parastagonospora nodorum]EAT81194.1 hypothetical protein SNOG_11486 [Parastagonospora nodorum SN15]KAH3926880.1 hypothetical protein HBH54_159950 [Parastagonospora nodorum]KAH4144526.1 hypothetical protein HBH45_025720 [Parastagonospora nodorum]KAH4158958.1 hypothetical protein HBH44_111380 [Parastagonospora nodorum]
MSLAKFAKTPMRNIFSGYYTLHNTARSRAFRHSIQAGKGPAPAIKASDSVPRSPSHNPTLPSFNLFQAIRDSRSAVRYTVYAGLGLMATVESTFWFHVIKAKFFPSSSAEEQQKNDQYLAHVSEAIAGYKSNWMRSYRKYYEGYVWGVGER